VVIVLVDQFIAFGKFLFRVWIFQLFWGTGRELAQMFLHNEIHFLDLVNIAL
jgi:hypothetical protein